MAREKQRVFKESLAPKIPNKKVNESTSNLKEGKRHQFLGLNVGRDAYAPTDLGGTMTVEELIEELQTHDMSLKVVFVNDGGYTYGSVSRHNLKEFTYEDEEDDVYESKEKGHMKFKSSKELTKK